MFDVSDDALRDKINELVARLPASLVYNLLSEIEGMDGEPPERLRLVRQYVIEYLNRQRTNRARRLFTRATAALLRAEVNHRTAAPLLRHQRRNAPPDLFAGAP